MACALQFGRRMELSNEQLACVTGGFGDSVIWDAVQCHQYRLGVVKQRAALGAALLSDEPGKKMTSQQYLDAQAAIEKPEPAFCAGNSLTPDLPRSSVP